MVRRTVTPESRSVTIEIPQEYVNKRLRVEIWEEPEPESVSLPEPGSEALAEVDEFYASISRDLSGYVFNRDDVHG